MQYLDAISKRQSDLCWFPREKFSITLIPVYVPTNNAEEAEVEWFYEDLQDLLELTAKNDILFIIGNWKAEVKNSVIYNYRDG